MSQSAVTGLAFWLYTGAIIVVGLLAYWRRQRGLNDDFFLGGRRLGPWLAAISASASSESGWVMLGLVGAAYTGGVSALWLIPGCAAGYLFNWYWLGGRLRQATETSGALTLPDFLGRRFASDSLRAIGVIIIVAAMAGYIAAQMTAAGKAFEAVFSIPYRQGVVLGTAIILLYTASGGFRAVVWTDFIQGLLMVGTLIILPILAVAQLGGLSQMLEGLRASDPNLLAFSGGKAGMAVFGFVIGWLGIGLGYPGQPHVVIRFMASRDNASIRVGGIVAFVWSTLVFLGAILLGLACRVLLGDLGDAEQALPIVAVQLLPAVIAGVMLAAVLAAICSTADSQLLVCVSAIAHDLFRALLRKKARLALRPNRSSHRKMDTDATIRSIIASVRGVRITDGPRPEVSTNIPDALTVEITADRPSQLIEAIACLRRDTGDTDAPRFQVEEERIDWINRSLVVLLGLLAMGAALSHNRVIFSFVLYAWSALGAAFGPVVILALAWRKTTKIGALVGMLTGVAVTVIWRNIPVLAGAVYELVPAFVFAFAATIVVSLVTRGATEGGRGMPHTDCVTRHPPLSPDFSAD